MSDAGTKYVVDIVYETKGSPGGDLGKLTQQADAFSKAQKAMGKELGSLGRSAVDAFTGAVEAAGRLAVAGAGMALGAGIAGAVYGVTHLNASLESTRYAIAAIGEGNNWSSTFSDGLLAADGSMKRLRESANAGLGTFEDLVNIFQTMSTPAGQSGMSQQATEAMASKIQNYGAIQKMDPETVAREAAMLLQGRAGAHNVLGSRLGIEAKSFNAASAGDRAKTLETTLASKLRPDALAAFSNTYAAQSTTLISNLKKFGADSTAQLFDRVVSTLREVNTWVDKNKDSVDHWANVISSKLTWAWDTGKALIMEWGPLVSDFASNAEDKIAGIWADVKPSIVSIGETLKEALKDPGTLDKMILALKLYAGIKAGGALMGPLMGIGGAAFNMAKAAPGALSAASGAVGAAGGIGPALVALGGLAIPVAAVTVALGALGVAAYQGVKLYEEHNQYLSDTNGQIKDLVANLARQGDMWGEIDKSSTMYIDNLAMITVNSGEAAAALLNFATDLQNEDAMFRKEHAKQADDEADRQWNTWGKYLGNMANAALDKKAAEKKKEPTKGAGNATLIVYQTISSNQAPGQVAQSVVNALATAVKAKKVSRYGFNIGSSRDI